VVPDALTGGPRFAAFCEHYVRHTKGKWARQPVHLEDWQRDFWWEALEVDPTTGLRVYSEVGLDLPRKNGKSVQASAAGPLPIPPRPAPGRRQATSQRAPH
jgi:phage terminase large subunit-like protein